MSSWPARGENGEHGYQDAYANVPTSPSLVDPLQLPVRTPHTSSSSRPTYVSSPLNPNAVNSGQKSRPVSWGANAGLEKGLGDNGRPAGSSGSDGSGNSSTNGNDRDAIKSIMTGSVGGGLGPYAPFRGSHPEPKVHQQRFSTVSSVGSMISLTSDSKYPTLYGSPNNHSHLTGSFLPYSDNPQIDYNPGFQGPEDDDALHDPNPRNYKDGMAPLNWRGVLNVLFVFLIIAALVALFAGYPVLTYFIGGSAWYGNSVGINGTGQAANLPYLPRLIDPDTPEYAKTRTGFDDGLEYDLVFSDEFNLDGRTFFPGDDPFWEAVDLYYWATGDYEWYDPSAITTSSGSLVITLDSIPNHDLWYRSGMLQSWNKFCFTGGYIEVSVVFPGDQNSQGYWPAAWTMGNLGRPGYGATTDGTWPYTYDSCDVGTLPNQTLNGQPALALTSGRGVNGALSYLPGQRLSACTCQGQDHPGPNNKQGRNAPEIDIFEAERSKTGGPGGQTSQSCQFAPFAAAYAPDTSARTIHSPNRTIFNTFLGSPTQQSISSLTQMDPSTFQNSNMNFSVYGVEFWGSPDNPSQGFINWVATGTRSAGLTAAAAGPDTTVGIGQRQISNEPMSIVLNLGLSKSFQSVNLNTLQFPAKMFVDYVRVYQRKDSVNVGCNPPNYPTANYINNHLNAYTNPNFTSWTEAGYTKPLNSLVDGCT